MATRYGRGDFVPSQTWAGQQDPHGDTMSFTRAGFSACGGWGAAPQTIGLSRRRLPQPLVPALAAGPNTPSRLRWPQELRRTVFTDVEKTGGSSATQAPKVPARARVSGGETEAQQAGFTPATRTPDTGHVQTWHTHGSRVWPATPAPGLPPRPLGCRS